LDQESCCWPAIENRWKS